MKRESKENHQLNEALKRVAVIGAAGKMGRGISALLLQEMVRCEAEKHGSVGKGHYRLLLIDTQEDALFELKQYLKPQLIKYAEKNIAILRRYFAEEPTLISNEEIINSFVEGGLDCVFLDTDLNKATHSTMIFEAIVEDVEAKTQLFSFLNKRRQIDQLYFSNTSSIPIKVLQEKSDLPHNIIGFHFYNPPLVQQLVELIVPDQIDKNLQNMALDLAIRLRKIVVKSHDIAGFIGNGHFIRELLYACRKAQEISPDMTQSIYILNKITQDYLLRPMGIFQLMDYVGINICANIASIMKSYLPDPTLKNDWLERMASQSNLGGQFGNGTQKDGCFKYEKNKIVAVFSLKSNSYVPVDVIQKETKQFFGELPKGSFSWKELQSDPEAAQKSLQHLKFVHEPQTPTEKLAVEYFEQSHKIAEMLVQTGVADHLEDVDKVLKYGFYHLYGSQERKNLYAQIA